jgi:hypothetical protein
MLAEQEGEQHEAVAAEFDQGPSHSNSSMNGKASQPGTPPLRENIRPQFGVQALGQAALPADALVLQGLEVFRRLGPADRVGHEFDAVGLAPRAQQAVHAHDQFHVLADGVDAVAADR